MVIVFSYWLAKKCTGKKGFIKKWKQRKEKIKLEKIEKMKAELRKQGLIVDDVDSVKVDAIEQNPNPKYYGMDTLPAVWLDNGLDNGMEIDVIWFVYLFYDSCVFYFIFSSTMIGHGDKYLVKRFSKFD